jgi:hypothetical protein
MLYNSLVQHDWQEEIDGSSRLGRIHGTLQILSTLTGEERWTMHVVLQIHR